MSHRYKIAQVVELIPQPWADRRFGDEMIVEVIRQMPEDAKGEYSYRVKSPTGVERAVRESDIRIPGERN